jgi:hypothetical protein
LEEVDDFFVGDVDYNCALVEKAAHVLAERLALLLLDITKSIHVPEHPMAPAKLLVNWVFSWSHWSIEFLSSDSRQLSGALSRQKGK